jgi:transcriptional regulator with XRE-family HTH domain
MNKLQDARKNKGWNLTQAGDAVGVTYQHFAYLERGERAPSVDVLERLCVTFGLPADDILVISRERRLKLPRRPNSRSTSYISAADTAKSKE